MILPSASVLLYSVVMSELFFFFFQAEDGIRDSSVTGVQTCALPIFHRAIARELLATLAAPVHVRADALDRVRRRLAHGRGQQVRLDLPAARRNLAHGRASVSAESSRSRPFRIFRSAWKTWARALSSEQRRLVPISA